MGPPPARETVADEGDWRRPRPSRNSASPTNSTPATPQMGRRKLELLPRSGGSSVTGTPLASPKGDRDPTVRSNPFGAAKPVDVSNREKVVEDRLERDREATKERFTKRDNKSGDDEEKLDEVQSVQDKLGEVMI
ncbi:hypothetical protein ONZ45_g15405 [Pleurotus djamor]|nr:hypothetical protein ONZ45_g15405 [Pleurotus djamor]